MRKSAKEIKFLWKKKKDNKTKERKKERKKDNITMDVIYYLM